MTFLTLMASYLASIDTFFIGFHPFFPCFLAVLSVDAIDMSGKHEVDLDTNIWKVRELLIS